MNPFRIIGGIFLVLFALFCVFGALASLEPAEGRPFHTEWLIGYIVVGISSVVAAIRLFRSKRQRTGNDSR